jgi:hypothetical protein
MLGQSKASAILNWFAQTSKNLYREGLVLPIMTTGSCDFSVHQELFDFTFLKNCCPENLLSEESKYLTILIILNELFV